MSEEELKIWFFDKLNNCYPVTHIDFPNDIFLYYDNSFIRKMKLSKISGDKVILPKKVTGKCLFDIDISNKKFYCSVVDIWNILGAEYSQDYYKVKELINNWIQYIDVNLDAEISVVNDLLFWTIDKDKLKVFDATVGSTNIGFLEEPEKLKVLSNI